MKKIFATAVTLCGLWAGTHSPPTTSAPAQVGITSRTIIPLTNQAPFVNTVVPPANLTTIQFSNVVTLLLTLQTNIEETLPVLDLIQSNAVVVSVAPTSSSLGIAPPLTNLINPILTPTGSTQPQTSLAVRIGTNELSIDASTLLGLFVLRGNLQQSLPILQALNGTEPTNASPPPASLIPTPTTHLPAAVTNFSPGPLTNTITIP